MAASPQPPRARHSRATDTDAHARRCRATEHRCSTRRTGGGECAGSLACLGCFGQRNAARSAAGNCTLVFGLRVHSGTLVLSISSLALVLFPSVSFTSPTSSPGHDVELVTTAAEERAPLGAGAKHQLEEVSTGYQTVQIGRRSPITRASTRLTTNHPHLGKEFVPQRRPMPGKEGLQPTGQTWHPCSHNAGGHQCNQHQSMQMQDETATKQGVLIECETCTTTTVRICSGRVGCSNAMINSGPKSGRRACVKAIARQQAPHIAGRLASRRPMSRTT